MTASFPTYVVEATASDGDVMLTAADWDTITDVVRHLKQVAVGDEVGVLAVLQHELARLDAVQVSVLAVTPEA